eukprot:14350-Heterococcus_DN1.PRE.2
MDAPTVPGLIGPSLPVLDPNGASSCGSLTAVAAAVAAVAAVVAAAAAAAAGAAVVLVALLTLLATDACDCGDAAAATADTATDLRCIMFEKAVMLPRARPAAVTRSGVTALTVTAGSVRGGLRVEMQAMSLAAAHFVCSRLTVVVAVCNVQSQQQE